MKRPVISKYPGNNVAAGGEDITDVGGTPIQAGATIRLTCFGAAITHVGRVELQIRTQVTPTEKWRTVRCIIGPGDGHYENLPPFEGDGTIFAMRVVRTNDDASDRKIKAWVEGFRKGGT